MNNELIARIDKELYNLSVWRECLPVRQVLNDCKAEIERLTKALEAKPVGEPVAMRHDGYVLVPVDEASNIIAMRKALEEIIEWTDRYTSPDHPITIFAKKALSAVKEKDNE